MGVVRRARGRDGQVTAAVPQPRGLIIVAPGPGAVIYPPALAVALLVHISTGRVDAFPYYPQRWAESFLLHAAPQTRVVSTVQRRYWATRRDGNRREAAKTENMTREKQDFCVQF